MIHVSDEDRRRAFAVWLRTGQLPPVSREDGVELKFNPWHDPANGRFTFAGSGQRFGAGEQTFGAARRHEPAKRPTGARVAPTALSAERAAAGARPPAKRPQQLRPAASVSRAADRSNATVEFIRGAAEGLSDTAVGAARGTYSLLTTNPVTTARHAGRALAGTIDAAIATEDVPARIQMSRAADAVAHASAYELGRAAGSTAGTVALAAAPGATLSKVSDLRRLRVAGPGEAVYGPLEVHWVKENLGRDSPAKAYNDAATGARPGLAPALMRTMSDGSKRRVKFDGIQGEYVIDRKLSVTGKPNARAQLLRQSNVLAQNHAIGIWEVPNQVQKIKAAKMLKRMNVGNIKVRVIVP